MNIVCQIPRSQASEIDGAFDFVVYSMRVTVEQVFGVLVERFLLIKRGLDIELRKSVA